MDFKYSEPGAVERYAGNPVLSKKDLKYPSELVFNAGVCEYNGGYAMLFRNDYGHDGTGGMAGTNIGAAFSRDGIKFVAEDKPFITRETLKRPDVRRVYDPRLTVINGDVYVCFAADTDHGVRAGIAVTDFEKFEILSLSVPDNRNTVLFPEKIAGEFVRLERPFPVYGKGGRDRFDIWLSRSPDLIYWGKSELVLACEKVPFCNDKIGPAAPPVRTEKGWLTLFHSVDRDESRGKNGFEASWKKRYCAGVMLLDLHNPALVAGLYEKPLMIPSAPYERENGYRNDVIFPGGAVMGKGGKLMIYYGAADTVECLAFADTEKLISLCLGQKK